ncbi:hypothetical protein [Enterococcus sp. DIV0756]|uniref:hypothetical protein n=1 Tax=Enterococcus sp. DIV0756 TaxID=2774636 RepID=UPI003F248997
MKCIKEGCNGVAIKHGLRGKKSQQSFLCKKCGYRFTLERKARLSKKDKFEILYLAMVEHISKPLIAKKFGVSRQRVFQIVEEYKKSAGNLTLDEVKADLLKEMDSD